MITPFNEVLNYAGGVHGWFSTLNMSKLYDCALESPGVIAEIGIQDGRSASVLLFAARHTGAAVILVDYWKDNVERAFPRLGKDFQDVNFVIVNMPSIEIADVLRVDLSLIHIDGDHVAPHPEQDCQVWLPKLRSKGIACFHDYRGNFEAVRIAVDRHTAGWEDLGDWDSLAVRRKP